MGLVKSMFKITEELLFKILILTAFVIYFYLSLQFPSIPMQEGYGAGLFPLIISVSFFLFAIKDFFTKNKEEFNKKENLVLVGFLIIIFIPMFFINLLGIIGWKLLRVISERIFMLLNIELIFPFKNSLMQDKSNRDSVSINF